MPAGGCSHGGVGRLPSAGDQQPRTRARPRKTKNDVASVGKLLSRAVERGPRVIVRKLRTGFLMLKNHGLRATTGYLRSKLGQVTGAQKPRLLVDLADAAAGGLEAPPARLLRPNHV